MKLSNDYTDEEKLIHEAVISARQAQDYLWRGSSLEDFPFRHYREIWIQVFQERVDKIAEINTTHPSMLTELRKRLLQQTALSILALKVLDKDIQE